MTILQIESFLAAAKSMSFTKAAEELYSSQPTISRQIGLLEEELGFALFCREKKALTLTPGGAVMLKGLAAALEGIEETTREARQAMTGERGSIALGCLYGTDVERIIHPFTVRFTRAHPAIEISVEFGSYAFLRNKLDAGELDVVFTLHFELPSYRDVEHRVYKAVETVLLISKDHPLVQRPGLSVADLVNETAYIPDEKDSPGRPADFQKIMKSFGIDSEKIELHTMPNLESILFAVRSGKGFAMSDTSMSPVFEEPYLRITAPLKGEDILRIVMVWKTGNTNPSLPKLVEYWDSHQNHESGENPLLEPLIPWTPSSTEEQGV